MNTRFLMHGSPLFSGFATPSNGFLQSFWPEFRSRRGGACPILRGRRLSRFIALGAWMVGLACAVLPAEPGAAWSSLGPSGGNVRVLKVDPSNNSVLYAGTLGAGVFKTANGGNTWTAINTGLNQAYIFGDGNPHLGYTIFSVAIDPNTPSSLYLTSNMGVYKSTNGGASWSSVTVPGSLCTALQSNFVCSVAVAPTVPSTVFVGAASEVGTTYYSTVFKSSDGGSRWTSSHLSAWTDFYGNWPVVSFAIGQSLPVTMYAVAANGDMTTGVFRSADSGKTWSAAGNSLPPGVDEESFVIDPKSPNTLYATLVPSTGGALGVYKSTDGGAHWDTMNEGLSGAIWSVALDPANPKILYASDVYGRFFTSSNGGSSWTKSTAPTGMYVDAYAFARSSSGPSVLYAASRQAMSGVFKSTDRGAHWSPAFNGLSAVNVSGIAIDPANSSILYATTLDGSSAVLKSTNGGSTWKTAVHGFPAPGAANAWGAYSLAVDPVHPDNVYLLAYLVYGGGGGLLKSTDGANNWSMTAYSGSLPTALAIDPKTSSTLYVTSSDGVLKSTDGANSWTAVNSGLKVNGAIPSMISLVIDPAAPATIFATGYSFEQSIGSYVTYLFKSVNGGNTWSNIYKIDGTAGGLPQSLAINPENPENIYIAASGIWNTANGRTWANQWLPSLSNLVVGIDPEEPSTLFAGSDGFAAWASADGGESWYQFSPGLEVSDVNALAFTPDGSKVYAATSAGVYSLALDKKISDTTTELSLSPNPSSSGQSVTLTATVSSGSGRPDGTVTFYEIAGDGYVGNQAIGTLGSATLSAAGKASMTHSGWAQGSHSVVAQYAGTSAFAGSLSWDIQEVRKAAKSLTGKPPDD